MTLTVSTKPSVPDSVSRGEARQGDLQVLPACVGNQVSTPAVAQLVGNDIHILTVTTDDGRGSKRVNGVLHAWQFCQQRQFRYQVYD